ncbi:MAG: precorrin-8X methylmutase [Deferribacteraceae bacterium]|jgi:precorrin-8X/cobalt-precorrin-8 methylmutase|nr:precorrin-8X methylmutase [Deferribacteraceae bacterium]
MKPADIEKDSFAIIENLTDFSDAINKGYFTDSDWHIVRRMIHACGDTEIVNSVRISANAVEAGKKALSAGIPVVCDVHMAVSGLSENLKKQCPVHCFITNPEVACAAIKLGATRAETAIKYAVKQYPDAIYIIGNAPTALLTLIKMAEVGKVNPALVVGIPVGFVLAAESKEMLIKTNLNYITNLGCKGGTPMAVAAINALK